jgi:hypothetical protein
MSRLILERALSATGLLKVGRTLYRTFAPGHRRQRQSFSRQTDEMMPYRGASYAPALDKFATTDTALVIGYNVPGVAVLQFALIAALRANGHRVVVRLDSRLSGIEDLYRRLGAQDFIYQEDYAASGEHPETDRLLGGVSDSDSLLKLVYRGLSAGKFAASTLIRRQRLARIDLADEPQRTLARIMLSDSLKASDAALRMIADVRPKLVCFIDRGYTPEGHLYEAALSAGIDATTLNSAHRGGLLMLKRYRSNNRDSHPSSLSKDSWARLSSMPWTKDHWQILHGELDDCYRSGSWYDEVGTQFNKVLMTRDELKASLGLDPAKKTAVLFAHMFWDATFFWGDDLFQDYSDWFQQSLKAAAANTNVNWLIKVHPANLIKDRRDGYAGEHSEIRAIREALGTLPAHMKILPADSPIATFSLFEFIDYCLTVRGTVGVEAACFGIPVLTAGSGRYDRLGFTVDHDSREAYLANLARIETIAPLSEAQIELAHRFTYGIILTRPLRLRCLDFTYRQDEQASMNAKLVLDPTGNIVESADISAIRRWLRGGGEDILDEDTLSTAIIAGAIPGSL